MKSTYWNDGTLPVPDSVARHRDVVMSEHARLSRLTTLLYGLAATMFAGTTLELLAASHYQEPVQLIPLVLCGLGIVAIFLAWRRPGVATVQGLRMLMLVTAAATLLGIWKHVEANMGFILEREPATSGWALIAGALTGRNPLLASGALAAAAATALAATFAAGWSVRGETLAPAPARAWQAHARPSPS